MMRSILKNMNEMVLENPDVSLDTSTEKMKRIWAIEYPSKVNKDQRNKNRCVKVHTREPKPVLTRQKTQLHPVMSAATWGAGERLPILAIDAK